MIQFLIQRAGGRERSGRVDKVRGQWWEHLPEAATDRIAHVEVFLSRGEALVTGIVLDLEFRMVPKATLVIPVDRASWNRTGVYKLFEGSREA